MKNNKRILAALMVMVLSVMMTLPVSAATPDVVPGDKSGQVTDSIKKVAEPMTPDGNLTLVDDFSGTTSTGKQFVTLVTKNGNYFYLIIDRDDKGKETVHFLNQVDEADLLALMEEEEIESLGLNKEPVVEIVPEEPEEIVVEAPVSKENSKIPASVIMSVGIFVIGIGIVAYAKMKDLKKKKTNDSKCEPEEEEYYEFMELEQEMRGEGLDE